MEAFLSSKGVSSSRSTTSSKAQQPTQAVVPWVEKYRPRKVDDIVFQDEVVSVLKKVLKGADLPNLLFYGPPGTGKTSAAVALCRELFKNPDVYSDRVLEMNASDERGINIVRTRIKEFARRAVSSRLPDGSHVLGLKVIILDEADAMTDAAQAALRRTMEKESRSTRFFLICNYISRIIPPLTSRCAKFRFKPLSLESQKERLEYICEQEDVEVEQAALIELIELCGGDLRRSVTHLQTMSSCHTKLTPSEVRHLSGAVPDSVVRELLAVCERVNFDEMFAYVESIRREGYGVYQLMTQLFSLILHNKELLDTHKSVIFEKMAECEVRLLDGADEFLQLLDLSAVILEQYKTVV
uniref:Replication factor C subunit 4 n=1 Tax=Ascaris suum TaxID=6253 RepID=F1L0L9_ASCSU